MRILLILLLFAAQAAACPVPANLSQLQSGLVRELNAARQAQGLGPLAASAPLTMAAQRLACDNAARRVASHSGADGSTLKSRLAAVGYRFAAAAENAAGGYADAAAVTQGWMASPPHRRNILTPALRDIGVGIATGGDGLVYWVIDLGSAR